MRNPTRLIVIVGILLVVIAAVATFLPTSVLASQLHYRDQLVQAAAPIALELAEGESAPSDVSTTLSDVYVARVDTDGTRTVLVRPLVSKLGSPDISGIRGTTSTIVTVGSVKGPGSWRVDILSMGASERVVVAVPVDVVRNTDRPIGVVWLIARLVVLAFAALSGVWLLRSGLRPIREVTRVAEAISSGDRTRRVSTTRPTSPAGRLANSFNEMLDEQHASEDRLRRFVADASHELRTPITAIAGFADLYRHGAVSPDQLDEVMRRIGQESARMRALVEDMLSLARLDEGQPQLHTPVDLMQLAEETAFELSGSYPSRTVVVEGERVVISADETQCRQILLNLVSNALAYTAGAVRVDVTSGEGSAQVTVDDDGPGLTAEQTERMFDRFWRADGARGRAGTGLGLAIVKGFAESHGGTVVVSSDPTRGTRVTVMLPLDGQETGKIPAGTR